jgi:hypothetical protein
MTQSDESAVRETVTENVTERVVSRECEACGEPVPYAGTGRPPRFCSPSHRQRAWALRAAARQLDASADPRPRVVREVVERVVTRTVERTQERPAPPPPPARPASPGHAREWVRVLGELAAQLGDERHPMVREHWHHRGVYDALVLALRALDQAHPGGLDRLPRRR